MEPTLHYIMFGEREGRKPTPEFDPYVYRAARPELTEAKFNLYWLYLSNPPDEILTPVFVPRKIAEHVMGEVDETKPYFQEDYYLSAFPAARGSNVSPLVHYLAVGEAAGLRPREDFDPHFYMRSNPDLLGLERTAFWHYCAHGRRELRVPQP